MNPPRSFSRRAVLGAGAGAALAPLAARPAQAATGWRMLPETISGTAPTPGPSVALALPSGWSMGSDGIPRLHMADGRVVIHPTQLGNLLWERLAGVWGHRDAQQLALVARATQALMQKSAVRQGARFLSYDFAWHDDLKPGWHSSFGQAKFPKILHLLERLTGERRWALYRQEVVAAFRMPPVTSQPALPWVAAVDANNCLWLDEYPSPTGQPSTVFNGHYFALSELASYVAWSGDPAAAQLASGAAATLDFYRNYCRVPGGLSNYYADQRTNTPHYHHVNIQVYAGLFNLTGASRFGRMVDLMENDYPDTIDAAAAGHVRVVNRAQRIMRPVGSSAGAATTWTPSSTLTLRTTSRHRWANDPHTWLYMTEGPRAGYWVQEQPYLAYRTGTDTDLVVFTRPREVLLPAGRRIEGWSWDAQGNGRVVRTASFAKPSLAHSYRRARLGGAHHILISDGVFKDLWVPEGKGANYR